MRTPPEPAAVPALDADQRAVVDHRDGPLLVLAGPGTGKTTALTAAVAERMRRGADPERILVLTFSRRAATGLREALAARIGSRRSGPVPQATTFHAYCYALVRAHQDADLFAEPLRLLSGPEQDVMVRELLAGEAALARQGRSAVHWPDELRAALTTRGFADELRAVLARTRELGLGPDELGAFARRSGRPDWRAAAEFLAQYLDVLDAQGVLDYAELVHRAVLLAERPEVTAQLRSRYDAVYVDEYQDTDPAQVRLLQAVAGDGRTLVVFGDPDQSIYAFRGADTGGILDFPTVFRRRDGAEAPVRVLRRARRSATRVLRAGQAVAGRLPLARLPAEAIRAHRTPAATRPEGRVEVLTYPTPGAELDNIADLLRRAHLEDGVAWSDMAVLVRAGARSIPAVRRALTSAGVPLEIAGDDLPLRHEPAVAPLLTALRAVAGAAEQPDRIGTALDTRTALDLLTSPLGGMDAADLRRLGRALRDEERAAGVAHPRPSDVLLAEALAEPERLVAHDPGGARGAQRLGLLLRKARELLAGGGSAEEALWELWSGTPWPQRLERAARRGGAAGRNADRDLDAICALFATAARAEERIGGRGALNFLAEVEAQDIAADTLTRRAVRPDAVRLMTAHRAKGLQWHLVVVAGVQEGLWPDLRRRGSLLEADRIGRDGITEPLPPGALLTEERRLFHVAVTRAAERLVVTAVRSPADDGDQPSRFLAELGVPPKEVTGRPRRPLSVPALVAELRATTVDPAASPELREAAAERLARLAALRDDEGHALVPAAHPSRWWGLMDTTRSRVPLRDPGAPVELSGSALEQLAGTCSLQWFLGREVKAEPPPGPAQGFGNVLHVLADEVASGSAPADLPVLMERLDKVWDTLAFDAPWKSLQEKEEARAALERFVTWHSADRDGRRILATEQDFDITLQAGTYRVRVRGVIDRVEQDGQGRVYVVDFKTGKQKPSRAEVEHHAQLAVYQRAVHEGAVAGLPGAGRPVTGGAELVHLRLGAPQREGGDTHPAVQRQESPTACDDGADLRRHPQDPQDQAGPDAADGADGPAAADGADGPDGAEHADWIGELLATAAGRVLEERFAPSAGQHCTRCAFRSACSARPEGRHIVE